MHRADRHEVTAVAPQEPGVGQQVPVRFVLMRGGTSKAVFLREGDLPQSPAVRDRVILALFGSPDPRQVDGLGGADILTSKLAVIGPTSHPDADLDYTFGQVSITEPAVDYDINCGNISAAVGVYAIQEGLVRRTEPVTRIRIHNTNTRRVFAAEVPVQAGEVVVEGDLAIDGVPGTGAAILLDYAATSGSALLPSGRALDVLDIPGIGEVEASICDLANLCVFVAADAVGMAGTEGPAEVTAEHLRHSEAVKEAAAHLLDRPSDGLTPIPVVVSAPTTYARYGDRALVNAEEVDLVARVIGGRPPMLHKTFPGTAAVCTGVAAAIPGTVAHRLSAHRHPGVMTIGHPSGRMQVLVQVRATAGEADPEVGRAAYQRTARRLAEGYTFVQRCAWSGAAP